MRPLAVPPFTKLLRTPTSTQLVKSSILRVRNDKKEPNCPQPSPPCQGNKISSVSQESHLSKVDTGTTLLERRALDRIIECNGISLDLGGRWHTPNQDSLGAMAQAATCLLSARLTGRQ